ncbi:LysM peptidoglycan-binding domain-containing protein [Polaribacter pacificus]|nr:LysM peptidoglycan-binding domain-containing protein [Polaribacter pacificus]
MKHLKIVVTLFVLSFAVSCGQQKKYITYKVQEGETLTSIAGKLDMTTKDLLRLNPNIGSELTADTEIFIPNKKGILRSDPKESVLVTNPTVKKDSIIDQLDPTEDLSEIYVMHKVAKGDTFYSLTRYYNVLQSDLLVLNPALKDGLKLGTTIKIKERVAGEKIQEIYKDTIALSEELKVALLLPFRAEVFDTLSATDIFKDRLANIITDFYLGAEIAIDSLQKQGVMAKMQVFDTGDRNTKINTLLNERSLKEMDVIIGPLYSDELERVAGAVNAPVVYPVFSGSQSSFSKSKIVKTAPDKNLYTEKLLSHMIKNYRNENIIIVGDSTATSMIKVKQLSTFLKQHDSIDVVHEIVPHNGYIAQERLLKVMKVDTTHIENWVLIASQNKVIASDVVNSLISFPEPEKAKDGEEQAPKINYAVKAFSFENGSLFSMVNHNKLAHIGFTYVSDRFMDESAIRARVFNKQYLKKNKALPSDDAIRGFDVTYDVVMRMASGDQLNSTYKKGISYRLQAKFDFHKRMFGLTENRGLYLLEYQPDLSVIRLDD